MAISSNNIPVSYTHLIREADVHLAAGLPLTWIRNQREDFRSYRSEEHTSELQSHSEIVTVPSDFRMLISQQSSTTPVQPVESINTKTEVFFMRELRNTKDVYKRQEYCWN